MQLVELRLIGDACAPQEVQQEKAEKKAKKAAELAAKLASRNVENLPVQPVFTVPAWLSAAPVVAAVPFGSPIPMQPMLWFLEIAQILGFAEMDAPQGF